MQEVKRSLDDLLLSDRARLNGLMRKIHQRIHDRQPADRLLAQLKEHHARALRKTEQRARVKLDIAYPDILPIS